MKTKNQPLTISKELTDKARIFSTEQLQSLLAQGLSQKEAADCLGVSPAAVSKRMKRLPPPSLSKLTPKEKKFVEGRAKGLSQTGAALQAYDVVSRESAKTLGHTLSKTPEVAAALSDLMEYHGIGRSRRVQKLAEIIESPDQTISLQGLKLSFSIDGTTKERQEQQKQTIALVDLTPFLMRPKEIVTTSDE